jgi:uncharacterized membrane protein
MSKQPLAPRIIGSRQRGAVAIWIAVSLVALISATFLAIDTGQLYYAQKQLEKSATMAAIAGAQIASGCVAGDGKQSSVADVVPVVQSLLLANGGSPEWLSGINGNAAVEVGRTQINSGGLRVFEQLEEGDPNIDSVRVNLSRPMPSAFLPTLFSGAGGTLVASSTARQRVVGTFYVGAGLLRIDSEDSALLNPLLSALLGTSVNLSVADYRGLANVNVSLDTLALALGVEAKDLSNLVELDLDSPLLPNLLGGLADGLDDTVSGTVRQVLRNLAGAAKDEPVPLGALLGPLTDVIGAVPFVNLLDLIIALGQAASATPDGSVNPIIVPLALNIPGVLTTTVYLQVLEPPQFGIGQPGEATAKTAAIKLAVRIDAGQVLDGVIRLVNNLLSGILQTITGLLRLLTLGLVNIQVTGPTIIPNLNLGIDVNVAQAAASLDSIRCPGLGQPEPVVELSASPAIASVHVGSFTGTPTASYFPPLDTNTTTFDVLKLGLRVAPPLAGLGSLNLDVALDLSCVSVGGACYGPSQPSAGPFIPLPNAVEQFTYNPPTLGVAGFYQAEGAPSDDPVPGENPQTVGSNLDVVVDLNLRQPITSGSGALGGLAYVLNALISGVLNLLDPLLDFVSNLLNSLVLPLLDLLGIHLGEATVFMNAVSVDRPITVTKCIPGAALPRGCAAPGS